MITVLLATAVFPFGGTVAPWQAPTALLLTFTFILLAYRNVSLKQRLAAIGLFVAFLCVVWVVLGCFIAEAVDHVGYHYPKIFLMMKGWNPFYENTFDALTEFIGQPLTITRPWHILFLSQSVEVFNATIGFFLKHPQAPFLGLSPFIAISSSYALWQMMRVLQWTHIARWTTLALILGGFVLVKLRYTYSGDLVVYFSFLGAMACMIRVLYNEKCFIPLIVFSLWMMTTKQSALLSCFVLWCCFAILLLWSRRANIRQAFSFLTTSALLLIIFFVWICSAPYISSWRTYGHPLYPAYTGNAERFPTHDITWDFLDRNDDAKQLGHIGHFINAHISSTLICKYYAWKLKREFKPTCRVWWHFQTEKDPSTPVTTFLRCLSLYSPHNT